MLSIDWRVPEICALLLAFAIASNAVAAAPSPRECANRDNDTPAKAAECIRQESLWDHLKQFQIIADHNPGPDGHPNRNIGTSGYKASVDYVARLMRKAGYKVTVQRYRWRRSDLLGVPILTLAGSAYQSGRDWQVGRFSGSGRITAVVQPAGAGCGAGDFSGFARGRVALVPHASCPMDAQVANAEAAGAAALLMYGTKTPSGDPAVPHRDAIENAQQNPARIPVLELLSSIGDGLSRDYTQGHADVAHIDVQTRTKSDFDYNVIADSPFGNPDKIVVLDAHLDAIFGAGMLDNASGSTTIRETARRRARTKTVNRLRYIWFGGEEIGLLGSKFYTQHLDRKEVRKIVFDIDADVTATPNFAVLIADPAHAHQVNEFPPNVVPLSRVGNKAFADYFRSAGIESRNGNNDGTDSLSFSLVGVPNSGVYTQQDCCKHQWEVDIWGGYLGNYEGKVPGHNGGCVDYPNRWCDNLSNNDPFVLEFASKAVAYVTLQLANDKSLKH